MSDGSPPPLDAQALTKIATKTRDTIYESAHDGEPPEYVRTLLMLAKALLARVDDLAEESANYMNMYDTQFERAEAAEAEVARLTAERNALKSALVAANATAQNWRSDSARLRTALSEIGMPIGCCDLWPECSHVLAWYEARSRDDARLSRGYCSDCKKQDGPCWCGDTLGCTC